MNYNIASYLIYLPVMFYITIKVGWTFYKNGQHYIDDIIPGEPHLAKVINRMLLLGYYLLNLGYVTYNVSRWEHIGSSLQMCNVLSARIGFIMVFLGVLHFINMFSIWLYGQKVKHSLNLTLNK